tara:strand:- start:201 stop:548 length:348 start_codon:yes stop_codon:yes gene_type:complete
MFKSGKQFFQVLTGSRKLLSSNSSASTMIGFEVAMFESWYVEKHKKILTDREIYSIIRKILVREDFIYTEEEVDEIQTMLTVGFPENKVKQVRIQNDFDNQVRAFCRSINCEHLL